MKKHTFKVCKVSEVFGTKSESDFGNFSDIVQKCLQMSPGFSVHCAPLPVLTHCAISPKSVQTAQMVLLCSVQRIVHCASLRP